LTFQVLIEADDETHFSLCHESNMKLKLPARIITLALATVCLFSACAKQSADSHAENGPAVENTDEQPDATPQPTTTAPVVKASVVDVNVASNKGFHELIATHAGKVVFVDYWATW
jgi:hypothetical protein